MLWALVLVRRVESAVLRGPHNIAGSGIHVGAGSYERGVVAQGTETALVVEFRVVVLSGDVVVVLH